MSATRADWTACGACNRGGRGNDKDKCACGWQEYTVTQKGCFCGMPIEGTPQSAPKLTRSQARYQRYLEVADCYPDGFAEFLRDKEAA